LVPKLSEFELFFRLDINGSISCLENAAANGINKTFCDNFNILTNLLTKQKELISIEIACKILSMLALIRDLNVSKVYFTTVIKREIIKNLTLDQMKMFANKLSAFAQAFDWNTIRDLVLNLLIPVFKQENSLINCYLAKVNIDNFFQY